MSKYYYPISYDDELPELEPLVIEDGYTVIDADYAAKLPGDGLIFRRYCMDGPDEHGEPVYRLKGVMFGISTDGVQALRSVLEQQEQR